MGSAAQALQTLMQFLSRGSQLLYRLAADLAMVGAGLLSADCKSYRRLPSSCQRRTWEVRRCIVKSGPCRQPREGTM